MIKRTFDIIAAILGLIVCSPLFVLVAVFIKRDSPGPVFSRQTRMGKGFRRFYIYNFRTMIQDGSQKGGPLTTEFQPTVTGESPLISPLVLLFSSEFVGLFLFRSLCELTQQQTAFLHPTNTC